MPFDEITEKFSGSRRIISFCRPGPEIFANCSCQFFIDKFVGTGFIDLLLRIFLFVNLNPPGL